MVLHRLAADLADDLADGLTDGLTDDSGEVMMVRSRRGRIDRMSRVQGADSLADVAGQGSADDHESEREYQQLSSHRRPVYRSRLGPQSRKNERPTPPGRGYHQLARAPSAGRHEPAACQAEFDGRVIMLYTIAVVLIVLWLLGMVSSYTMGGFIHVLLVIAIIVVLLNIIQGRRVL
jgi:hypothetical protein